MPTNHTGDPTAITPRQAVVVSNPTDGDPRSAASNNAAIQVLADILKYAMDKMGIIDVASTWTALQSFSSLAATTMSVTTLTATSLTASTAEVNGNAHVDGTLDVDGEATVGSLEVVGNAHVAGGLDVTANIWTAANLSANGTGSGIVGPLAIGGVNAGPTVAHNNKLTAKTLIKAWALIDTNAGVDALVDGFNVASAVALGDKFRVTMAFAMASTNYAIFAMTGEESLLLSSEIVSSTVFDIEGRNPVTNDLVNVSEYVSLKISVMVLGAQN